MIKKLLLSIALLLGFTFVYGQWNASGPVSVAIRLASGELDFLQNEKYLQLQFTYNDMGVGKMSEQEYVNKKVNEYNKKEPGRGDEWKRRWTTDRMERFQPQFIELFNKYISKKNVLAVGEEPNPDAHYVMVINTDFIEPGFNVGVARQSAHIDATCVIYKIDDMKTPVAKIVIRDASADDFLGTDFDTGYRVQECFAKAGRELAKFLIKRKVVAVK
jgi:hypothetical protein